MESVESHFANGHHLGMANKLLHYVHFFDEIGDFVRVPRVNADGIPMGWLRGEGLRRNAYDGCSGNGWQLVGMNVDREYLLHGLRMSMCRVRVRDHSRSHPRGGNATDASR